MLARQELNISQGTSAILDQLKTTRAILPEWDQVAHAVYDWGWRIYPKARRLFNHLALLTALSQAQQFLPRENLGDLPPSPPGIHALVPAVADMLRLPQEETLAQEIPALPVAPDVANYLGEKILTRVLRPQLFQTDYEGKDQVESTTLLFPEDVDPTSIVNETIRRQLKVGGIVLGEFGMSIYNSPSLTIGQLHQDLGFASMLMIALDKNHLPVRTVPATVDTEQMGLVRHASEAGVVMEGKMDFHGISPEFLHKFLAIRWVCPNPGMPYESLVDSLQYVREDVGWMVVVWDPASETDWGMQPFMRSQFYDYLDKNDYAHVEQKFSGESLAQNRQWRSIVGSVESNFTQDKTQLFKVTVVRKINKKDQNTHDAELPEIIILLASLSALSAIGARTVRRRRVRYGIPVELPIRDHSERSVR